MKVFHQWVVNCFFLRCTVYDTSTTSNVVVLNTIHIDIMDYILPATCTDTEFRQMWQDFEWENKVSTILLTYAA